MADITICDPPYNVGYGDSLQREEKKILGDNQGEKFELFLYDVCSHILSYTKGAVYICTASAELSTLQKAFKEAGGHWSTFIIWAKNHFTLGRADYQRQYEGTVGKREMSISGMEGVIKVIYGFMINQFTIHYIQL